MSHSLIVGPPQPHVRSKDESALVRRLDMFLMTFGCISQVIKYIDQNNINNAYVSGMKEGLGLYGNELNLFTTLFNVGYCIMLIPSQIILTYVRPSWWLPCLEITWGVITGLIAMASSAKQVYILRFFLGLCESTAYPGMITILMYWYTPTEMAKRIGFYHSCQAVGAMMSGALQAAITSSLDGRGGLAGWRWLFVINAVMTVIWGFCGFVMIPDSPNKPNPWAFWFKRIHAELAVERLRRNNRVDSKKITWAAAKRTFRTWVLYFIPILYISITLGLYGYNYFGLFLKSLKNANGTRRWSTEEVNLIPIGGSAINVAFVWIWALLSDYLRTRWTLILAQACIGMITGIIMTIYTTNPRSTPISVAYAGYFMLYSGLGVAPLIWSWLSDIAPQDPESRSLVVGVSIAVYYSIGAWSQVLVWPAVQAPLYKYGWQSSLALLSLAIIVTCVLHLVDIRYIIPKRRQNVATSDALEGSSAPAAAEDIEVQAGLSKEGNEVLEIDCRIEAKKA